MDDFDEVTFVMNNHRLSAYRLCAEAYKRGMLRAAEIAGDSLGEDSDACCLRTIQRVCAAIEKEANK